MLSDPNFVSCVLWTDNSLDRSKNPKSNSSDQISCCTLPRRKSSIAPNSNLNPIMRSPELSVAIRGFNFFFVFLIMQIVIGEPDKRSVDTFMFVDQFLHPSHKVGLIPDSKREKSTVPIFKIAISIYYSLVPLVISLGVPIFTPIKHNEQYVALFRSQYR